MFFIETLLIGISLSMDALAVSIALGAVERGRFTPWRMFATAFSFGVFQALMPTAGWFGGSLIGDVIQRFGNIVAFLLLFALGAKMVWEAYKGGEGEKIDGFTYWRLMILSFATSIDAFLVGVGYACLGRTKILWDVILIGCTTFVISGWGCTIGRSIGGRFGHRFEALGGAVLMLIGLKILIFG